MYWRGSTRNILCRTVPNAPFWNGGKAALPRFTARGLNAARALVDVGRLEEEVGQGAREARQEGRSERILGEQRDLEGEHRLVTS